MYPAQALFDGLYTADDLPDEVLYNDGSRPPTVLQKTLNPELVGGVGYPWPQDGSDDAGIYFIVVDDGGDPISWAFGDDRGEGTLPCLIQGDGNLNPNNDLSEDQFADTYTVTINPPDNNAGTYTVTRRSICVWSTQVEESGEPAGLKLSYIDAVIGGGFAYTWEIELDTSYIKDGFANTPTGNYAGGNATVS
jgi:hypothetical protein